MKSIFRYLPANHYFMVHVTGPFCFHCSFRLKTVSPLKMIHVKPIGSMYTLHLPTFTMCVQVVPSSPKHSGGLSSWWEGVAFLPASGSAVPTTSMMSPWGEHSSTTGWEWPSPADGLHKKSRSGWETPHLHGLGLMTEWKKSGLQTQWRRWGEGWSSITSLSSVENDKECWRATGSNGVCLSLLSASLQNQLFKYSR